MFPMNLYLNGVLVGVVASALVFGGAYYFVGPSAVATLVHSADSSTSRLEGVASNSTGRLAAKVDAAANKVTLAALAVALSILVLAGVVFYGIITSVPADTIESVTAAAPTTSYMSRLTSWWGFWIPPVDLSVLTPTHTSNNLAAGLDENACRLLERAAALQSEIDSYAEARDLLAERRGMAASGCHSDEIHPSLYDGRPPRGREDSAMGTL